MTTPCLRFAAALSVVMLGCRQAHGRVPALALLPGMPAPLDSRNVYAGAGVGMVEGAAREAKPLVYVPLGSAAGGRNQGGIRSATPGTCAERGPT